MFSFNGWQPGQWKLRRFFQVYTWMRKKAWNPSCSKIISSAKSESKGPKTPVFSKVPKVPWVQISGLTLGQPTNQPLQPLPAIDSSPQTPDPRLAFLWFWTWRIQGGQVPSPAPMGMVDGFVVFAVTGDRPWKTPGNTQRSLNWLEFSRNVVLDPEKPRKRWIYLQDHGGVV